MIGFFAFWSQQNTIYAISLRPKHFLSDLRFKVLYRFDECAYISHPQRSTALFAQVAELVDALVSGISDRKIVEVRVFSWAPISKNPINDRVFFRLQFDPSRLCTYPAPHYSFSQLAP